MPDALAILVPVLLASAWVWRRRRAPRVRRDLHQMLSGASPPIMDAGSAPLAVVARSLQVPTGEQHDPPRGRRPLRERRAIAWDLAAMVAPLGLAVDQLIEHRRDRRGRTSGFAGSTVLCGTRHGRRATVRLADDASSVELSGPGIDARIETSAAGELRVVDGPRELVTALDALAPSRRWSGLTIDVGRSVQLRRAGAPATSWMHDLWLAEFVADVGAIAAGADGRTLDPAADAADQRAAESRTGA